MPYKVYIRLRCVIKDHIGRKVNEMKDPFVAELPLPASVKTYYIMDRVFAALADMDSSLDLYAN